MSHIKRMTPLRVVDDVDSEGLFYEAFGATKVETDTPDCVGYRAANDTGVILTSRKLADTNYGPFIAGKLARHGALYFHVDNIDAHLAELEGAAHLLVRTHEHGVEEAVVETEHGLIVLAAKMEMVPA
jgi:hypothetical protein